MKNLFDLCPEIALTYYWMVIKLLVVLHISTYSYSRFHSLYPTVVYCLSVCRYSHLNKHHSTTSKTLLYSVRQVGINICPVIIKFYKLQIMYRYKPCVKVTDYSIYAWTLQTEFLAIICTLLYSIVKEEQTLEPGHNGSNISSSFTMPLLPSVNKHLAVDCFLVCRRRK